MSNIVELKRITDALDVQGFSEWDDSQMYDLFGRRIYRAAQRLLITEAELKGIEERIKKEENKLVGIN